MQHVSGDDVQNAEASQDSDGPRLEGWRWSPGVGAIGNCHIQIAFFYVFENSTLKTHSSQSHAAIGGLCASSHHWYRATALPA
jgi:hypothetical protein